MCLQVIFRSYFLAGFFFFPLVFLGTIQASNSNIVDFLFKFVSVTKPYTARAKLTHSLHVRVCCVACGGIGRCGGECWQSE